MIATLCEGPSETGNSLQGVSSTLRNEDTADDDDVIDAQVLTSVLTDVGGNVPERHDVSNVSCSSCLSSEFDSDDTTLTGRSITDEDDEKNLPSAAKMLHNPVTMSKSLFVCETIQLQQFIEQINSTSICHTPRCSGKLVPVSIKLAGLGGAIIIKFTCTGCGDHKLNFNSSVKVTLSKCTAVSLVLQVAFVIAGCAHAQYAKVLKQCLGMSSVSSPKRKSDGCRFEAVLVHHGFFSPVCNFSNIPS